MNETEILKETKEMKSRLIYFVGFFLLTIALGVLSIAHSYMLPIALISLAFMFFNGVLMLYKAMLFGFKRLLEVKKCRGNH